MTLYAMRHTFASICYHNDVPVKKISEMMGHKNEKVTISVFIHPFNPDTVETPGRHGRHLGLGSLAPNGEGPGIRISGPSVLWALQGLNLWPPPCQGGALPLS